MMIKGSYLKKILYWAIFCRKFCPKMIFQGCMGEF